jgi:hypothetical protein
MSLLARIEKEKQTPAAGAEKAERPALGHPQRQVAVDPLRDIKKRVHESLLKEVPPIYWTGAMKPKSRSN